MKEPGIYGLLIYPRKVEYLFNKWRVLGDNMLPEGKYNFWQAQELDGDGEPVPNRVWFFARTDKELEEIQAACRVEGIRLDRAENVEYTTSQKESIERQNLTSRDAITAALAAEEEFYTRLDAAGLDAKTDAFIRGSLAPSRRTDAR